MALFGPDVSDWQEHVDWAAVKAAGASFGACKASEGTGNVQETLEANRTGMAAAHLTPIFLYHFAHPEWGQPGGEANHFCDTVGRVRANEVLVLDIEVGPVGTWTDYITSFGRTVKERLGVEIVVYVSESPANSLGSSAAVYPLWVAGYVERFPTDCNDPRLVPVGPWSFPLMWQFTSSYQTNGIGGRCDYNIAPSDLIAKLQNAGCLPLPVLNQEGVFMALTDQEQKDLLSQVYAVSGAVGRIEVSVRDDISGIQAEVKALSAKVDKLLARK